jgi:hypothetical protein
MTQPKARWLIPNPIRYWSDEQQSRSRRPATSSR